MKILASACVHTCGKISLVPRPDPVCWSPWETTKMAAGEQSRVEDKGKTINIILYYYDIETFTFM